MAIPAVNITILDGGLGAVLPSNSKTHAKIGVSSLATASVAASKLIASTTGGDGVTFTAVTAGAQGNLITITYNAPSGGSTSVSVIGNSIVVSPKSGALNSDIVTAIGASAAATLVTAVATGASDTVVAVSATHLLGGVTGTENTIYPLTSPGQCLSSLGYGPLSDACAYSLQNSAGLIYAVMVNPSVAGAYSSVVHVGSGSPAVTVANTTGGVGPFDSYNVVVTVVAGGVLGAGTFTYSLDSGTHVSAVLTIPSGGTYAIPNTNMTLTFASGTYVAADTYNFSTTAPSYNTTDLTNAMAALTASSNAWNFVHAVGQQNTVTLSATMATTMDSLMAAQASAYRYVWGVIDCATDTDANLASAFSSFVSNRTMVCASTGTMLGPVSGLSLNRPSGWAVTARAALVSVATDLGQFNVGPLPQVAAIQRDEFVTPYLDALGFTTLRTFPGQPGFYITGGHMMVATTSSFYNVQNRRVMDQACAQTYASLLFFLNSPVLVNKSNGTISETSAQNIETKAGGELAQSILAPGFCSATTLVVDRSNNVLSTNTLNVTTSIVPLGYAKTINETITFINPGLQVQQAAA